MNWLWSLVSTMKAATLVISIILFIFFVLAAAFSFVRLAWRVAGLLAG